MIVSTDFERSVDNLSLKGTSVMWQVEAMEMLTNCTSDCVLMHQRLQRSMTGALISRSQHWIGVGRGGGGGGGGRKCARWWGGRM